MKWHALTNRLQTKFTISDLLEDPHAPEMAAALYEMERPDGALTVPIGFHDGAWTKPAAGPLADWLAVKNIDPTTTDLPKARGASFTAHVEPYTIRVKDLETVAGYRLRIDGGDAFGHCVARWILSTVAAPFAFRPTDPAGPSPKAGDVIAKFEATAALLLDGTPDVVRASKSLDLVAVRNLL